jgi:hypothetical protein
LEGEIQVLEKARENGGLTAAEQTALLRTLELRRATAEVFRGKQELSSGNFNSALHDFNLANKYFQSWKLWVVMLWLRLAPRLLQRAYRVRAATQD